MNPPLQNVIVTPISIHIVQRATHFAHPTPDGAPRKFMPDVRGSPDMMPADWLAQTGPNRRLALVPFSLSLVLGPNFGIE